MQNGYSGDLIILEGDTVLKICKTDQNRFLANVNKQRNWNNRYVIAVPIIEQGTINGENYARMQLVKNITPISRINENNLYNYLILSLIYSKTEKFNYSIYHSKIDSLMNVVDEDIRKILLSIQDIKFKYPFYCGKSHSDLTFDNLLFCGDIIMAIDFLTAFVESPILDICKLLQSVKWNWNGQKNENLCKRIELLIDGDEILKEYVPVFEILNMVRILPYTKDSSTINYLKNVINELYANYSGMRTVK